MLRKLLLGTTLLFPICCPAEVFKCVDALGQITYKSKSCEVAEKNEHIQIKKSVPVIGSDLGKTAKDGGLIFTLEKWQESLVIPRKTGKEIRAKDGAKFVLVRIKFKNERKSSVDIHCSFDLGSAIFDKDGRQFDEISGLSIIEGNTDCGYHIQPGFETRETIAFEMPIKAKPEYVMFWDPNEMNDEVKDSFGKKSGVNFKLQ